MESHHSSPVTVISFHAGMACRCEWCHGGMQTRVYALTDCLDQGHDFGRLPPYTWKHPCLDPLLLGQWSCSTPVGFRPWSRSDQRAGQYRYRAFYESGHAESGGLLCETGPHGHLRLSRVMVHGRGRRGMPTRGMESLPCASRHRPQQECDYRGINTAVGQ